MVISSYIGWNVVVARDNFPQMGIDTGGQWFTWERTTGLLTIYGDATVDELISITPV